MSQTLTTPHFRLHYHLRQAPGQLCFGTEGIRHRNLALCYAQALENLYTLLTNPPFDWLQPPALPIDVRLEDTMTPRAVPHSKGSFIVLPSRYEEPDLQLVRRRAAVNAVHEATHIFCFSARPPRTDAARRDWRWMHEAMAVFMEGYAYPDNPEANRFALEWVDQPHVSLDAPAPSPWRYADAYHSGWFLRYVVRRFGPEFAGGLWNHSRLTPSPETPFEALHRLLLDSSHRYRDVLDPTGAYSPLFAEYCFDAYHLNDQNLSGFAPDVYVRYRGRALREWNRLDAGQTSHYDGTADNAIPYLACHYHRVDLGPSARGIEVRLRCAFQPQPLVVSAALVDRDRHRKNQHTSTQLPGPLIRTVSLGVPDPSAVSHAVICVANPALAGAAAGYRLEIQAV